MTSSPPPHTSSSTSRTTRPRNPWLWIIIVAATLLSCSCLVTGVFAYVLIGGILLPARTVPMSGGSASAPLGNYPGRSSSAAALDFMQALKGHSYLQAYHDLDDTLLIVMSADDFVRQAALADSCAGPVTAFHLVKGQVQQGAAQFIYRLIRSKLHGGYPFSLSLKPDSQGKWAVTDYGSGEHLAPPGVAACQ